MEALEIDAVARVGGWIDLAIAEIDERLGDGYAKAHPELLGTFLGASAAVYQRFLADDTAYVLIKALESGLEKRP